MNQPKKRNLLEMMTPEDQEKMKRAFEQRMRGDGTYKKEKIPSHIYLLAEAGIYFGWDAIRDALRGYIEAEEIDEEGKTKKIHIPLDMDMFNALVMAGKKYHFSDLINKARSVHAGVSASIATKSSQAKEAFEKGTRDFRQIVED